ncbi:MAG: ParB/RepB/Spo0J family partition protein [Bacilli bacterium]|jgi:ParB family chromosome partitioning protein|nr:ParB/RepB/Spo0J family partition protein [Bacilli bacterium]
MKKENKRLGKGLEALLGGDVNDIIEEIENNYNKDEVMQIELNKIAPNPYQPRKVFDKAKINELALSIENHGMFTPIIVKATTSGYNIVAGERRFRAAKQLKMATIPALVVDFDDKMMIEIALLENIQRENLNPLEEAQALKMIMDKYDYTQEEIALKMGKSRSHIANILRLLTLNKKVQKLLLENKLSMGHAKVLVGLDDKIIEELVNQVITSNLNVRDLEKLVNNYKNGPKKIISPKVLSLEEQEVEKLIREKLGTKIRIANNKIEITYTDTDDLNRILELLDIKID